MTNYKKGIQTCLDLINQKAILDRPVLKTLLILSYFAITALMNRLGIGINDQGNMTPILAEENPHIVGGGFWIDSHKRHPTRTGTYAIKSGKDISRSHFDRQTKKWDSSHVTNWLEDISEYIND